MPTLRNNQKITHIAIIMDGNRRWAAGKGMPKLLGHTEGAKNLKRIAKAALKRDISYLTLWALSTENFKRGKEELRHLFSLFDRIIDYFDDFVEDNVRFNIIGDLTRGVPDTTRRKLEKLTEKTKHHKNMTLTLAVNYGGRDEIVRAVKRIIKDKLNPEIVTEEKFACYLDTVGMPEPELIIRTGGHHRLSGYLPWQSTYSELYFTDTYWPAFDEIELDRAIEWFGRQQRNHGR